MECRQDCYWYEEVPDMGARIPFCKLKKGITPIGYEDCEHCENYHSKYKKTNADCLRSLSDEGLAEYLSHIDSPYRMGYARKEKREWLDWLKEEAQT